MISLILCGGLSTRMGTDKGLIKKGNLTWVERQENTLKSIVNQKTILISINPSQLAQYQKKIDPSRLVVDHEIAAGPLRGILTSHLLHPQEDILVLACDLIEMASDLLEKLLIHFNANKQDVSLYRNQQGFLEPLAAIYSWKFLGEVLSLYSSNTLEKYSMKFILSEASLDPILLESSEEHCFTNHNTLSA